MSIRKKTASVLAVTSVLALCGLGAAPSASAAAAAPVAAPLVTGTGGVQLVSYDAKTGAAVLSAGTASAGVKVGQVIDSLPCAAAPDGALLVVTGVRKAADGKMAVSTRPGAINELLGSKSASVNTALSASSFDVTPEVSGLEVSYVPRIDGASASASMALKLSADTDIDLPDGTSAEFSGSMEVAPAIDFDYTGAVFDVQKAHVGFTADTRADWHVKGRFATDDASIKVPLASLSASPVLKAAGLPVVVNLDLTLYAHITADGEVTVDVEQSYADDWGVYADYTKGSGWSRSTDSGNETAFPVKGSISGEGDIRTGLLTEGTVAIFDSLGVKAGVEPYLRTTVSGKVVFDGEGGVESQTGPVELYGGLDVGGALFARLRILGTTLFERDLPFTVYREEWPLLSVPGTSDDEVFADS
ncbi:hypothetical protein [Streptomyces solicathayae]|uniref:Lipoprotein n=1 Tax=Streptomyces solicathayae TaxID=3081768 RepID=A0ABZ0LP45_9ACTN|nr:hypothetical protein [Streptomyces sp. HUAS YS2]WOX21263.1 hypothetical protein R2D22_07655 [Streptomyces sp. HUAS YS2]